jgi:hypothetical protein
MTRKGSETLRKRLRALSDALEDKPSPDLSCVECQACLPAYVEAELNSAELPTRFPAVWQHLLSCDACAELYADLLEVSALEETGGIPVPTRIPQPDLAFLPSPSVAVRHQVEKLAASIVQEMIPEALTELPALFEVFFKHVEALGGSFQVRSGSQLALAFGVEAPALPILAAAFSTTQALFEMYQTSRPVADIKSLARREARRLGLGKSANRFATEYTRAAGGHLPWLSHEGTGDE